MSPTLDMAGGITIEGRLNTSDNTHPIVFLKSQTPNLRLAFSEMFASFQRSDRFTINDVIEGDYHVQLNDLPKDTYVKSIRSGATDVLNGLLHVDPRSNDRLEIVLGANAATVDGVVVNKNGQPVPKAPVALVPDVAHRERADLYRSALTDEG